MAMEEIKKINMCFVTRVGIGYKFINVDTVNRVELSYAVKKTISYL